MHGWLSNASEYSRQAVLHPGRRERRTGGILSAVGDVSYTRWYAVEGACKSLIKQRTDLSLS